MYSTSRSNRQKFEKVGFQPLQRSDVRLLRLPSGHLELSRATSKQHDASTKDLMLRYYFAGRATAIVKNGDATSMSLGRARGGWFARRGAALRSALCSGGLRGLPDYQRQDALWADRRRSGKYSRPTDQGQGKPDPDFATVSAGSKEEIRKRDG